MEPPDRAQGQVGFIPNMYARMVNSPGLLETYLDGYAVFRAESGFSPSEQELVLLVISRTNGCEYCMAAHSMLARSKSGMDAAVLEAVRNRTALPDPRLAALAAFTEHLVTTRGKIQGMVMLAPSSPFWQPATRSGRSWKSSWRSPSRP